MKSSFDNVYPITVWLSTVLLGSSLFLAVLQIIGVDFYEGEIFALVKDVLLGWLIVLGFAFAYSLPALLLFLLVYRTVRKVISDPMYVRIVLISTLVLLTSLTFKLFFGSEMFKFQNQSTNWLLPMSFIVATIVSGAIMKLDVANKDTH